MSITIGRHDQLSAWSINAISHYPEGSIIISGQIFLYNIMASHLSSGLAMTVLLLSKILLAKRLVSDFRCLLRNRFLNPKEILLSTKIWMVQMIIVFQHLILISFSSDQILSYDGNTLQDQNSFLSGHRV